MMCYLSISYRTTRHSDEFGMLFIEAIANLSDTLSNLNIITKKWNWNKTLIKPEEQLKYFDWVWLEFWPATV